MKQIGLMGELWSFMRVHKKLWLLPVAVLLVVVGVLLFAVQGTALGPFIYSIF
jgi:hypothetical protein